MKNIEIKWNNLCNEAKLLKGIVHQDLNYKPAWYNGDKFKTSTNMLKNDRFR